VWEREKEGGKRSALGGRLNAGEEGRIMPFMTNTDGWLRETRKGRM